MAAVTRKPGPGAKVLATLAVGYKGLSGKAGWFESSHYPDGMPVAYAAAINEFGYPEGNIPPRLGMRATADKEREYLGQVANSGNRAIVAGKATPHVVMDAVGQAFVGKMKKHITEVFDPPLKAATIAARLRERADKKTVGNLTKPLENTMLLFNTITNVVEKE